MTAIGHGLSKKGNVPKVAERMNTIEEVRSDGFWDTADLVKLEEVRIHIRDLIKFLDKGEEKKIVYTNFEDELGEAEENDGFVLTDASLANYRAKMEKYIRAHEDHMAIQKLKLNKPITSVDVDQLEKMLFSESDLGTREDFIRVYGEEQPLGVFIRSIIGLDRGAAKEAFSEFLSPGVLSADQIRFMDQIIDYLTLNGTMEPGTLMEIPFTDMHDDGVYGVFADDKVVNLVDVIERINRNAGVV